ncbi:MAG TPA: hypothetical protein VEQ59_09900 [Polyangiaceae bacterium]|nr:hypothetical protein [Polyangiaceae bacterium]
MTRARVGSVVSAGSWAVAGEIRGAASVSRGVGAVELAHVTARRPIHRKEPMNTNDDIELHDLEAIEDKLSGEATDTEATDGFLVASASGFLVASASGFLVA